MSSILFSNQITDFNFALNYPNQLSLIHQEITLVSILIPKEAERRTFEAAKGMIDKSIYDALTASNNNEAEMPRYMQV